MRKLFLLGMLFAATVCNAQVVLWNGTGKTVGSKGGFWDRAEPTVVEEGGNKIMKFTLKANPGGWADEHHNAALPVGDVDFKALRRLTMRLKMTDAHNVLVQLEGKGGAYNAERIAWYNGGDGWQVLVYEFAAGPDFDKITDDGTNALAIWPYEKTADGEGKTFYIDDIQLEGPMVNGSGIRALADNALTGAVTLTGLMGKGNYKCTWDGTWHDVSYDDYAMLNSKLSSGITSVDATGATLNDFDADQFFYKNVNNVLYAPTGTSGSHANVVVDGACGNLNLNAGYAFNAPSGFTVTGSVNIFRTTRAGINSFCLPVEVSEGDLMFKDADPDPLANYLATYKETGTNVVFTKHATVAANTPFILDSKYAVTESNLNTGYYITIDCSVNNKTVVATPNSLGAGFVGVYAPQSANGLWGITDSGKLQPGSSTTIKAFHAYLSDEVGARASMISFDDEDVTGINEIERMRNVENEKFYNLNGQQVAQPTRGLYIVNGKKVVIK